MAKEVSLYTTQGEFERLHRLADTKKQTVHLPREALINLLMDHSTMLTALEASTSFTVTTPNRRNRPTLG